MQRPRELLLLFAALCITSAASARNSNWFTQVFFHDGDGSTTDPTEWVVQITSMARRPMTCTVSWTGVRVGSPYVDRAFGATNGSIAPRIASLKMLPAEVVASRKMLPGP